MEKIKTQIPQREQSEIEQMEEILKRQSQVRVLKPARDPKLPINFELENAFGAMQGR